MWRALALALLLAGCASPPADAPAVEPEPLQELVFTACEEHLAIVPFPMELVADRAPSDFPLVPFDPMGLSATVLFGAYACQNVQAPGIADGGISELFAGLLVAPPPPYKLDEATFHAVLLGGFTLREDLAELYEEWGVPMDAGHVDVETTVGPTGRIGHAIGGNDGFTAHLYTVTDVAGAGEAGVVRVFGYDGRLTGAVDLGWGAGSTQQGTGTVIELPGVPPIVPLQGIGSHVWDFDLRVAPVDLAALVAE